MVFVFVLIAVSIGFGMIEAKSKTLVPSQKTEKITKGMCKIIFVSPLVAAVVFAILFSTVLQGRRMERISHALIVFMLWMYATSFYVLILKYFKNKAFLGAGLIGLIGSASCAVLLTPLDRYCTWVYELLHEISFLIGGLMLAIWYFSFFMSRKR